MSNKFLKLVGVATPATQPLSVLAQAGMLEEVVVTARKREESRQESMSTVYLFPVLTRSWWT